MIPYVSLTYFGLALLAAIPALLLAVGHRFGRIWALSRLWLVTATLGMLVVQYADGPLVWPGALEADIWRVVGFGLYQWSVVVSFAWLRQRSASRWTFYGAVALALLPLLAARSLPALLPGSAISFLGISYATFRALDAIISLHDRAIAAVRGIPLLAFLLFFPTISAGPVDRYRRFVEDWQTRRSVAAIVADLDSAAHHLLNGILYKFILAALIKEHWLDPIADESDILHLLSAMYGYSLYLFFDFAGYSAFAIGISLLFGVHTPANFRRPFLATDIRDFWNRWHISLSSWFRDHVFMRFVMATTRARWFSSTSGSSSVGFLVTFGLMGLWHGVAWHYVLYGLYHAVLLIGHQQFTVWNRQHRVWGNGPRWRIAGIVVTFHAVCFGFLIFSGRLTPVSLAAATAEGASPWDGRLQQADCAGIGGWALERGRPDTPLAIDVYADDRLLGSLRADRASEELRRQGATSDRHGFLLPLPVHLMDGQTHTLRTTIAGTDDDLERSPTSIRCGNLAATADGLEGQIDRADCTTITGWAWDRHRPDRTVNVDLVAGDTFIATVAASELRRDLLAVGQGTGRYGFSYTRAGTLADQQGKPVQARLSGTTVEIDEAVSWTGCPALGSDGPTERHGLKRDR
jgi:membrane protein involved in D-alanine export